MYFVQGHSSSISNRSNVREAFDTLKWDWEGCVDGWVFGEHKKLDQNLPSMKVNHCNSLIFIRFKVIVWNNPLERQPSSSANSKRESRRSSIWLMETPVHLDKLYLNLFSLSRSPPNNSCFRCWSRRFESLYAPNWWTILVKLGSGRWQWWSFAFWCAGFNSFNFWMQRLRAKTADAVNSAYHEIKIVPELRELLHKVSHFALSEIHQQVHQAKMQQPWPSVLFRFRRRMSRINSHSGIRFCSKEVRAISLYICWNYVRHINSGGSPRVATFSWELFQVEQLWRWFIDNTFFHCYLAIQNIKTSYFNRSMFRA